MIDPMSHPAFMIGTGVVLGLGHAFDPDHIAAITAFVGSAPSLRRSIEYAVRWAAGHGMMILLVGLVAMNLHVSPEFMGPWAERIVGATLIVIALWAFRRAWKLHSHVHQHPDGTTHAHAHSHAAGPGHVHTHAPTAMGLLHGLAGSGGVVVGIPAALAGSQATAFLFLAAFGAGVTLSMLAYATGLGALIRRRSAPSLGFQKSLSVVAGVFNFGVGLMWIIGLPG
jgi:sulfite exporter TauE/SafE